ncbi:gp13 [Erwinia phage vB_EamM-Y2]|uniref:Gp13 n=1 Tax=Erwinia phage vB_EamM-Y2 TaxID=1051676 RepID=G0YPW2_9CAUD|nr:gp13 [Erwinia phage vB_EamM-Y2]AEJ81389.1 gp13 [Erwinia phage vB_EamM-Y2]
MRNQTWCKCCQENKDDEQIDTVCHSTMAQYGPIVICNGWCKDCSLQIIKDLIVDDDGLREPK